MNPLKQGLKPKAHNVRMVKTGVKEVNPLKQGLKPHCRKEMAYELSLVKEVNPLKQGLKRSQHLSVLTKCIS